MSGQTWPSRELVITCTHPTLGDGRFAPLVDQALREIAAMGTDKLPTTADDKGFKRVYQSPGGVIVTIRSAARIIPDAPVTP